jgi:hypothetical protein
MLVAVVALVYVFHQALRFLLRKPAPRFKLTSRPGERAYSANVGGVRWKEAERRVARLFDISSNCACVRARDQKRLKGADWLENDELYYVVPGVPFRD